MQKCNPPSGFLTKRTGAVADNDNTWMKLLFKFSVRYFLRNSSSSLCETDRVTIAVQTVWLQEERGLSLCRPVVGMIGSAVEPKR